MKTTVIATLIAIALLIAASGASYWAGAKVTAASYETKLAEATEQARKVEQVVVEKRVVVDKTNYKKLKELEDENLRLSAAVRSGGIRMYVNTVGCEPSGADASGLDDGSHRAELHPRTAADLVGLTSRADDLASRHKALTEWVNAAKE